MNKITNYKLGSDPELFLVKKDTGELFPAIGIIQGTKSHPQQMDGLDKGFTWQIDNMSLEFNTPPASTAGEWVTNHMKALNFIKNNIPADLDIVIQTSGEFDVKYLDMPGANEFGCEGTLNAWTQEVNPKPYCNNLQLRTTAGHLHTGFTEGANQEICELLVKTYDLFLTVPSLFIDADTQRRQLYGKAGEFRFAKSFHGVEHRSLSNFWLQSEELMHWVFTQAEEAIKAINEGFEFDEEVSLQVQDAINNYNLDIADKLIRTFNLKLPQSYANYSKNRQKETSF